MILPNLIIPGAQKSGTSSFYEYLRAHPQCCMSIPKEPSFFSKEENLTHLDGYSSCFHHCGMSEKGCAVVGEASTSYLAEEYAPQRIFDVLGCHVKFIIVLRSPAERTISAYWHLVKRGHETRSMSEVFDSLPLRLDDACQREKELIDECGKEKKIVIERYRIRYDNYLWPFQYLRNSVYSDCLDRFTKVFDKSNILVLILEDLQKNKDQVLDQMLRFLDLDHPFDVESANIVYNKTLLPRTGWPYVWIRSAASSMVGRLVIDKVPIFAQKYNGLVSIDKPPSPPALADRLKLLFAAETKKMEQRTGRNLVALGW